jgi:hypothetical protein
MDRPNRLWLSNIAEHLTTGGKLAQARSKMPTRVASDSTGSLVGSL